MIVNTETKVSYLGDGITTAFPVPFKFSDAKDVKLILYDAATEKETQIESDYYVDTESSVLYYPGYPPGQEPGEAMRPPIAPVGSKLVIYRSTPINQLVDMGKKYPLPIIEAMEDKLTFIAQEMSEQIDRSVKVDMGAGITAEELIGRIFSAADSSEAAVSEARDSATEAATQAEAATAQAEEAKTQAESAAKSAAEASGLLDCPIKDWVAGESYDLKDIRIYDGKIYQCIEANADTEFDKTKWQAIGGGGDVWEVLDGNAIIPKDLSDPPAGVPATLGTPENKVEAIYAKKVHADIVTGGGTKSLGDIVWRSIYNPQVVGEMLANGAEISRAMHPRYNALCAEQGYPWGDGDGATTFNLPNLIGRFAEGANVAGGYHEPGLPNIVGSLRATEQNINVTGAYTKTNEPNGNGLTYATNMGGRISFDASRSSPIYGNSDTVQPNSALLIPYVVVFTDATADSALVDMTQYDQELAGKANRDLSNLTPTGQTKLGYGDNDFTIIYPNGGSEASPAYVAKNSNYIMGNPFSGYHVYCVAEFNINGVWATEPFHYGWDTTNHDFSVGVSAVYVQDGDYINIQTGTLYLCLAGRVSGGISGSIVATPLPCRVKVWKIGKAV